MYQTLSDEEAEEGRIDECVQEAVRDSFLEEMKMQYTK
jgi:hypothetical protein